MTVRQARNRLATLHSDHFQLMKTIEQNLYELHSIAKQNKENDNESDVPISTTPVQSQNPIDEEGFVVVNSVAEGSPAQQTGLRAQDVVVSFGSVTKHNCPSHLKPIGELVQNSENVPILVKVKRDGKIQTISVIPKKWSGRGLLGAHFLPL